MALPVYEANLDVLTTGVMPGVNADHVPLWTVAEDVVMEASGVRPAPGYTTPYLDDGYFDSQAGNFDDYAGMFDDAATRVYLTTIDTAPVRGIHVQKQSDGTLLTVWGTASALFAFDGTSVTDVSRGTAYSGTESGSEIVDISQWSFAQWGDWVLATNGADKAQLWKVGTDPTFDDLTNFPVDTAQLVRVLGPHVLFFNTTGTWAPGSTPAAQNQLIFSAEDDVEEYDPSVNVTAGELVIRDFAGEIIAAEYLGQHLLLYGQTGVHIVQYGGEYLFTAQRGLLGLKAVSKNSVASIGARHIVLTQNGLYATDGLSFQPVAYPKLGDWLEANVEWGLKSYICHQVDLRRSIVKWTLPMQDSSMKVLCYNWLTDTVVFESRPFTAGTRVESLWRPLMATLSGQVLMLVDQPLDRSPRLETKPLLVANRGLHIFIDAVVSRWSGAEATCKIRFGETQAECEGATWEDLGTFSASENMLYVMRETMFVQLQLSSYNQRWLLSGLELLGKTAGRRL